MATNAAVDTPTRKMNIYIKEGGTYTPTEWKLVGTFDWPDKKTYPLYDLKLNRLYGVKIARFENNPKK